MADYSFSNDSQPMIHLGGLCLDMHGVRELASSDLLALSLLGLLSLVVAMPKRTFWNTQTAV